MKGNLLTFLNKKLSMNKKSMSRPWSREELILAFNLYLKLPFGKMHSRNIRIIELGALINRTPDSVAMRLSNFASVDPFHITRGIAGLKGGIKQVKPIWDEFHNNREELIYISEQILANYQKTSLINKYPQELRGTENLTGEDKISETKRRVNQYVFREMVLSNYTFRCAISGINIPELLIASHIVPWSIEKTVRLNPENGICLSPLYDKAFDIGLITITQDFKVKLSSILEEETDKLYYKYAFAPYNGVTIHLPSKYLPNKEFLAYHHRNIFKN